MDERERNRRRKEIPMSEVDWLKTLGKSISELLKDVTRWLIRLKLRAYLGDG